MWKIKIGNEGNNKVKLRIHFFLLFKVKDNFTIHLLFLIGGKWSN